MSELDLAQQDLADTILDVVRRLRLLGDIDTAVVADDDPLRLYLDGSTTVSVPASRLRGPLPAAGERVVVWRRGRKLLVLGRVSTAAAGEAPFLMHAGSVSLVFSSDSLVSGAPVTFPAPAFTHAPIVTWGKAANGNKVVMQHSGLSASGFTPVGATGDGSNYTGTVTGYWMAVQMTSTGAAG